ncbi:MAG: hypothetical protein EHM61_29180 [Acidobacteria bacterium]|nr:MAG: hypothetical protein EHM61_29180 [Acidobacteriota bacterium]
MANQSILRTAGVVFTRFALFVFVLSVFEGQMISAQSRVPFEKSNGMAVVPVLINGQGPFRFVLDTGSSACLIDESLAQELTLESSSKTRMMSAAGISEVPVYGLGNLKLGDVEALNVHAVSVPPNSEVLTSRKARGFLGLSFLSRFNFLLNYKDQSITFEPEVTEASASEAVYSVDRSQGVYVVLVPVGKELARFVLDSGADGIMLFNTTHFPYVRAISTSVVRTAYGERHVIRAEISGLRIGKRTLNKEKVTILTGQGPEGCDGLLPAKMFSSLYFDNRGDRLMVNPESR